MGILSLFRIAAGEIMVLCCRCRTECFKLCGDSNMGLKRLLQKYCNAHDGAAEDYEITRK
jgi:hypothetical protein